MLDIRYIREKSAECRERLAVRGDPELGSLLDGALALDVRRRELIGQVEVLKAERNERSREIGERKRLGEDVSDLLEPIHEMS